MSERLVFGSQEANEIAVLNRALSSTLPCPICEGDAQLVTAKSDGDQMFRFVCQVCRAQPAVLEYGEIFRTVPTWQATPTDAATIWNKAVDNEGVYTLMEL
jgi:transposase-like protein